MHHGDGGLHTRRWWHRTSCQAGQDASRGGHQGRRRTHGPHRNESLGPRFVPPARPGPRSLARDGRFSQRPCQAARYAGARNAAANGLVGHSYGRPTSRSPRQRRQAAGAGQEQPRRAPAGVVRYRREPTQPCGRVQRRLAELPSRRDGSDQLLAGEVREARHVGRRVARQCGGKVH